jgi:HPt (histidine-containing phosphotransfer) domain-containing protein
MSISGPSSIPARTAAIDIADMRRRLVDDEELIRDVARAFLEALPGLRDDVQRARECEDAAAARRAVHRLKGALLDVAAVPAAQLADQIERDGVGPLLQLPALLALVDEAAQEVERLLESL